MDRNSLIIGLFLFALFFFPIVYVLIRQNSKEKKNKNMLTKIATDHSLKLSRQENFGHLSLGIDSEAKKLLVLESKEESDYDIIDLTKVSQVRISKKLLPGSNRKTGEKIIHLSLDLENKNASKITEITFYDENDEDSTDAAIRLHEAKRWDDIIHKNLAV